jgi:DNA polymerase III subunit epsilon
VTRWDLIKLTAARLLRRARTLPPPVSPPPIPPPTSPLGSFDIVIVDVETTGWLPEQAMITEIGAVRLSGGRVTGEFSALVNPGSPIPADIIALTGITDEMAGQAPPMAEVLPGFLAFAESWRRTTHPSILAS